MKERKEKKRRKTLGRDKKKKGNGERRGGKEPRIQREHETLRNFFSREKRSRSFPLIEKSADCFPGMHVSTRGEISP